MCLHWQMFLHWQTFKEQEAPCTLQPTYCCLLEATVSSQERLTVRTRQVQALQKQRWSWR